MSATVATARGRATKWLVPSLQFVATMYLQALVWLGLWVLIPSLFLGFSAVAVDSGSMSPAVRSGDVLLVKGYEGQTLAPGRIVTFADRAREGKLVTHRVVGMNEDGSYQTKGDANRGADSTPVAPDQIVGEGRLVVPFIGRPLVWAALGNWIAFAAWALLTLLATLVAIPAKQKAKEARRTRRSRRRPVPATAPAPAAVLSLAPPPAPRAMPAAMPVPGRPLGRMVPPVPSALTPSSWLRLVLPEPPAPRLPAPPERLVGMLSVPPPPGRTRPLRLPAPARRAAESVATPALPRPAPRVKGPRRWAAPLHALLALSIAVSLGVGAGIAEAQMRATTENAGNSAAADTIGAPSNASASNGGLTSPCRVTVTWTASGSAWATGYRISRSLASGDTWTVQGTVGYGTNSFQQNVAKGTYKYRVVAYYGSWGSASSQTPDVSTHTACL